MATAFPPALVKQLSDRAEAAAASLPDADVDAPEDDGRVTDQETEEEEL